MKKALQALASLLAAMMVMFVVTIHNPVHAQYAYDLDHWSDVPSNETFDDETRIIVPTRSQQHGLRIFINNPTIIQQPPENR